MCKTGDRRDERRRMKYVNELQNGEIWKKTHKLPKANERWPTCLIIAPSTVVGNWERELDTVIEGLIRQSNLHNHAMSSGDISSLQSFWAQSGWMF
jgi:SNF2 family DNA or RNA helicase